MRRLKKVIWKEVTKMNEMIFLASLLFHPHVEAWNYQLKKK